MNTTSAQLTNQIKGFNLTSINRTRNMNTISPHTYSGKRSTIILAIFIIISFLPLHFFAQCKLSTTVKNVSCNGPNDGTIIATGSNGTSPYTYSWSNGTNSFLASGNGTVTNNGLSPGVYSYVLTDAGGCVSSTTFTLDDFVPINVNPQGGTKTSTCTATDGSAVINLSGGAPPYDYTWSNGLTGQTGTGLAAGTYAVSVKDANGCLISSSSTTIPFTTVTVDANTPAVSSTSVNSATPATCDGAASLTVSGGLPPYTYSWSSGQTTQNVTAMCPGYYYVIVTDAAGCKTNVGTITVGSTLVCTTFATSTKIDVSSCQVMDGSAQVIMGGGTTPYLYTWSNGGTTATINSLPVGTYSVIVTDKNGCTASQSLAVGGGPQMYTSITSSTYSSTCNSNDGKITVGTGGNGSSPYTYSWSNGTIGDALTGLTPGDYTLNLTVTDANGCVNLSTQSFKMYGSLKVTTTSLLNSSTSTSCNGSITEIINGGVAPYTVNNIAVFSNSNTFTVGNLCPGNFDYFFYIIDNTGFCVGGDTFKIAQNPIDSFQFSVKKATICSGACNGSATISPVVAKPFTCLWNTGETTPTATNLCPGTYTVTVDDGSVWNVNVGCFSCVLPIAMNVSQAPCNSSVIPSASATVSLGTPPYNYTWTDANNQVVSTTSTFQGKGKFIFQVVDDLNQCGNAMEIVLSDSCDLVWPGDANRDLIADNNDLLAIGVGFNDVGPVRPNATINWQGEACLDWSNAFSGGVNHKNADCNGDGIINGDDTLAILQNYGLQHAFKLKQPVYQLGLPDLTFTFPKDTIYPGDTVKVQVNLGTSAIPVAGVYGLAYSVDFNAKDVDSSTVKMRYTNSWLANNGGDLLSLQKVFGKAGKVDIAVTRTNHTNVSGSGQIGELDFVMKDDIAPKLAATFTKNLVLNISSVKAILADETVVSLNAVGDTAVISVTLTGIKNHTLLNQFKIYPNPAKDRVTIEVADHAISKVELINTIGEVVTQLNSVPAGSVVIETESLPAGMYYLAVTDGSGRSVQRLCIRK